MIQELPQRKTRSVLDRRAMRRLEDHISHEMGPSGEHVAKMRLLTLTEFRVHAEKVLSLKLSDANVINAFKALGIAKHPFRRYARVNDTLPNKGAKLRLLAAYVIQLAKNLGEPVPDEIVRLAEVPQVLLFPEENKS